MDHRFAGGAGASVVAVGIVIIVGDFVCRGLVRPERGRSRPGEGGPRGWVLEHRPAHLGLAEGAAGEVRGRADLSSGPAHGPTRGAERALELRLTNALLSGLNLRMDEAAARTAAIGINRERSLLDLWAAERSLTNGERSIVGLSLETSIGRLSLETTVGAWSLETVAEEGTLAIVAEETVITKEAAVVAEAVIVATKVTVTVVIKSSVLLELAMDGSSDEVSRTSVIVATKVTVSIIVAREVTEPVVVVSAEAEL